jgi:3-oxoacyl-[acyl-carrier-protein] synthase-1
MSQQPTITASAPLEVLDIGLVTPLATGWRESCAAIRACFDTFLIPDSASYSIASVPIDPDKKGFARLALLLEQAYQNLSHSYGRVPVLLAVPESGRVGLESDEHVRTSLLNAMANIEIFKGRFLGEYLESFHQGRASLAYQLLRAQEIIQTTEFDQVMIMAADSWLFPRTLGSLYAGINNLEGVPNKRRLLINEDRGIKNTDGFIPAEAAGVLVVGAPSVTASAEGKAFEPNTLVDAVAVAEECAPFWGEQVCQAQGLGTAIRLASEYAGHAFTDYPQLLSSFSGESYFAKELSLALSRNIHTKEARQPIVRPAQNLGDTGSVVGMAMVAMAIDGFTQGYAPGDDAICLMSSDGSARGAISLRYANQSTR